VKNIPQKIYLQVDAGGETPEDFNELSWITLSAKRVYPTDIEYVLAAESLLSYWVRGVRRYFRRPKKVTPIVRKEPQFDEELLWDDTNNPES
jgi:hypothetical protein